MLHLKKKMCLKVSWEANNKLDKNGLLVHNKFPFQEFSQKSRNACILIHRFTVQKESYNVL